MSDIKKENRFFVVNLKFVNTLSSAGHQHLVALWDELVAKHPQIKKNRYVCCNQDEPYAEQVWQIILEGERKKTRVLAKDEEVDDFHDG